MQFENINKGYNSTFQFGRLSVGLVVPIERYEHSPVPAMNRDIARVKLAEELGFSAVWLRDVPFNVPNFGDAGQTFDPFVYLGFLAAQTKRIGLGVASINLPLRHPLHVAKSAASIDKLSGGRLLLGVASGDRPQEYPAMDFDFDKRGLRFRESFEYIRQMQSTVPVFNNVYGSLRGDIDMLPKASGEKLPLLVTGGSQQDPKWIAKHADGWMLYPQSAEIQQKIISKWHATLAEFNRLPQPVMQPFYLDLVASKQSRPQPIHLGLRTDTEFLIEYLTSLEAAGVNHVALNLRFNKSDIDDTLAILASDVLPHFNNKSKQHNETVCEELIS
ncbi:MAG: TIGR03571 family LLM class oxidoreductase [Alteromonadaceae bacterium]|nr:TIGR03571 family LLM class oxidoreductase [Alteromonadaceae bacterium]